MREVTSLSLCAIYVPDKSRTKYLVCQVNGLTALWGKKYMVSEYFGTLADALTRHLTPRKVSAMVSLMRGLRTLTAAAAFTGAALLGVAHSSSAHADVGHGYLASQGTAYNGTHRIVVQTTVPAREMHSIQVAAQELRSLGASVTVNWGNRPVMTGGVIYIHRVPTCSPYEWAETHQWVYGASVSGLRTVMNVYDMIDICPRLVSVPSPNVSRQAIEHELGHAFGLTHYNVRYGGLLQIMNSNVNGAYVGYRAGDRNGLIRLLNNARLARV